MEVQDHLEQVVRPNMAELSENPGEIRRAFNAVAAADALAGYLYLWCLKNAPHEVTGVMNDSEFRGRLAEANADFSLVRDMAKAQKHIFLTRGSPQIRSADQVETRSRGWGQARWGEGRWGSPPQVVVETEDGKVRVVEAVLGRALIFLEAKMVRIGITPSTPQ